MNKRRKSKKVQFGVRVYEHQLDELKRKSSLEDRSISEIVRELLVNKSLISAR